jgi:hypothetical protein
MWYLVVRALGIPKSIRKYYHTGDGLYVLNRLSGEWGWFLLGLYIYLIYVIVTGLSIASRYRRVRKSRKT